MDVLKVSIRTLRFIGAYTVANIQAAMEYRTAFAMQVLTMAANDSPWLFFGWTYFHQFPLANGWQGPDIVILWALAACGFGISVVVFCSAPQLADVICMCAFGLYAGVTLY